MVSAGSGHGVIRLGVLYASRVARCYTLWEVSERRVLVALRLSPNAVVWADAQATRLCITRSEVLRRAMQAGMGAVAAMVPEHTEGADPRGWRTETGSD